MNNNNTLQSLQKVELEILKEFIRVCNDLKLTYYLDSGTLLGCIRHKGFIPWDDDIDVSMPRKDYDIFLEKAQDLLEKKYFLQTYKTDKEFTGAFAKIRNSETTFIETSVKNRNINHGIYIDIFPLDNYMPNKKVKNKIDKIKNLLIKLQINDYYYYPRGIKRRFRYKMGKFISNIFYRKYSLNELVEIKDRIATGLNNKNTKYCYSYSYNVTFPIYPKEILGEGKKMKFEDIDVNVPNDYDKYLKLVYGNYMKLPPEEKRISHHYTEVVDISKSYKNYIKFKENENE